MRLKKTTEQIPTNIDPRLQRIIKQNQQEIDTHAADTATEREIPVIAKVKDINAWNAIPGVLQTNDISMAPDKSGRIVTAKVSVAELENIRQSPHVLSLKAAKPVRPLLNKTIEETKAKNDLLPPSAAKDHSGKGVVVGIVDFGCDFAHKNFQNQDKSTRLLAIWDQNAEKAMGSPVEYGKVFTKEEINNALNSSQPYKTLGYPTVAFNPSDPEHGTHVMDIAAGNGHGTGIPGVAPNVDLVFVQLSANDIEWQGKNVVNSTFGDSRQLLDALKFIFDTAGDRPCVINLSLGTNGGAHDGTSLVEQGIDGLLIEKPNRSIVIAASNSFNDGIHAQGVVSQGSSIDLHWQVQKRDFTFNELEIWYNGEDDFLVEIITPNGDSIGDIKLGENGVLDDSEGNTLIFVANRKSDSTNGDNVIGIFLESGLPTGDWTIRLQGVNVNNGTFQAWIERDDGGQSNFMPPHDNTHTLGSISCGHKSIVVGSYDAHVPNAPISFFSSAGPTRDGRQKPEISAPGHKVMAAASGTINKNTEMSGTSMAAPAVTGIVALVLAEAKAHGINLTIDQIRDILVKTARKNPPEGEEWNEQYGLGRIDAKEAVKLVTKTVSVTHS
ncbi:S8 family peptidase [Bacillus gaemokensis]|uniref:Peptidase S8 n=1 Tax=Bacillus gaemokensis TaxID=574375 RepID=A0A073KCT9_9BACI|nr:S8 family peptidase [Bacillus gaemokensis]KEK25064.1 peptidase S8 [Bacillus gaemokensis]KYG32549.1 peptidase S8 [Bacillus gaemokensis]